MHQRMAPITGLGVCSFVGTTCVADLDPVVEKAVALGGQIALPKMPIPGIGWLAYIKDTEGNIMGLTQPDVHAK